MKLLIDVLTLDQRNPRKSSSQNQIDWNNSSDKKWLMNHMHWAMNNERTVTLMPNLFETARAAD